jgi:hypothetical protein
MERLEHLKTMIISIDWVAVASIAAIIVAIAAIMAIHVIIKREKFIFGLKLLFELNDYFNSDIMIETRKKAASSLLNDSYDDNIKELLDFFEMIGYLLKNHAISKQIAWCDISYWIIHYWYAVNPYIFEARQKIPKRWQHIQYLFRYISKIERKKHGVKIITKESIKSFLENEKNYSH